jgi:ribose transport system permease protein
MLAVLGGMLLVARLGSADPVVGTDLMLPAIAAAVMGGAALRGGEGSVGGAVLGAMLIAALQNGLTLINVQAYYQQLALGAIILIALILDRVQRRTKKPRVTEKTA